MDFNAIVNAHAAAMLKPSELSRDQWVHRGWQISFDMPPIPYRGADWQATHPDYDASYEGEEDGWVSNGLSVTAATYEELLTEIDCAQDDWEAENGQFGVGS